jgi:hypothetical protein
VNKPTADLGVLLRSMQPIVNDGVYVYASLPIDANLNQLNFVGAFREREGVTVITSEQEALRARLPILFRAAWITLNVHSDLAAVGFTAAFSAALSCEGISCNVVAGAYHDHLFVPLDQADRAMEALRRLQRDSQA